MRKRQLHPAPTPDGRISEEQAAAYFGVDVSTIYRWRRGFFRDFPAYDPSKYGKDGKYFRVSALKHWENRVNMTDFMEEICEKTLWLHREKGVLYIAVKDAARLLGMKRFQVSGYAHLLKLPIEHFSGRIDQRFKFVPRSYIRMTDFAQLVPSLAGKDDQQELEAWIKDLTEE